MRPCIYYKKSIIIVVATILTLICLRIFYNERSFIYPQINSKSFLGNRGMVLDNGVLPSSTNLTVNDITFTIKTSHALANRWDFVLFTWYQQAKKSVFWITDKNSMLLKLKSAQVLETDCGYDHSVMGLSCKAEAAYKVYMRRRTKWWCHMDDDMYVNTDVLVRLLGKYDPDSDVYIGRNSYTYPYKFRWKNSLVPTWFATGAGYCISRALAPRMEEYMTGGKLGDLSQELSTNEDCAVGFIINFLLHTKLTVTNLINTHIALHRLIYMKPHQIPQQAMLSYGRNYGESQYNSVRITAEDVKHKSKFFSTDDDPSRFFTIHCMLHPQTHYCKPV